MRLKTSHIYKLLTIIGMVIMLPFVSKATHIVGGDIQYRCLGNDQYEITMVIYRDCINANPEAIFESPAALGVFDANDNYVLNVGQLGIISLSLVSIDTLPTSDIICMISDAGVCVEVGTYRAVVRLPFLAGGYQLAYQRCCRNGTLSNIVDPLESGLTLTTRISEGALAECYSSPQFGEYPPIFACIGEEFVFDQSVEFGDADQVEYRLYNPLLGATKEVPIVVPPINPPYDQVLYQDPYNIDNLIGGELSIDAATGIITAIPATIGQFLIGVEILAYKNGNLLGVIHRDFEMNVRDCSFELIASFNAPDIQCNNLTVQYENTSQNANVYQWYFDYPNNTLTSNEVSPAFTFPDYGEYNVALIASKAGTECIDTFMKSITLIESDIEVDFTIDTMTECADVVNVSVSGSATGGEILNWSYAVTDKSGTELYEGQDVTFQVDGSQTLEITLIAEASDGCVFIITKSIGIVTDDTGITDGDSLLVCSGSSLQLNPGFNSRYQYNWEPSDYLDDPTSPNPIATPEQTITYTVTIYDTLLDCTVTKMITLDVINSNLNLGFAVSKDCGSLTLSFINTSENADSFVWTFGDPSNPDFVSTDPNPTYTYPSGGDYIVQVSTPDNEAGCIASNARLLTITGEDFMDFEDTISICAPNDVALNPDRNPRYVYQWEDTIAIENPSDPNPEVRVREDRSFNVTVFDPLNLSCTISGVVTVLVGDEIDFNTDTIEVCPGQPTEINPDGNPNYTYSWTPAELFDDPTSFNPDITTTEPLLIEVTISNEDNSCTGIFEKYVKVKDLDFIINFSFNKCCGDPVVPFVNLSENVDSFEWYLGDVEDGILLSTDREFTYDFGGPGSFEITLHAPGKEECNAITKTVSILDLSGEMIPDTLKSCGGTITELNPNGDPNFLYMWSPADLVDDPTSYNPNVLVSESTLFYVTITDPDLEDCFVIDSIFYDLAEQVDIDFDDATDTICPGDPTVINVDGNPNYTYEWMPAELFDDPNAVSPSITVDSSTTIMVLVTDPASGCFELFEKRIEIFELDFVLDFSIEKMGCGDPNIRLINLSEDVDSFEWYLGDENGTLIGTTRDLEYTLPGGGMFAITLVAPLEEMCTTRTRNVSVLPMNGLPVDDIFVCEVGPVSLNPNPATGFEYTWLPPGAFDDPNSPNPTVNISGDAEFYVIISDPDFDDCSVMDTLNVHFGEIADIIATAADSMLCQGDTVTLSLLTALIDSVEWYDPNGNLISTENSYTFSLEISGNYTVNAFAGPCTFTDGVFLSRRMLGMEISPDGGICPGQAIDLTLRNNTDFVIDSVIWAPADMIIFGQGSETVAAQLDSSTTVVATVYYADGCISEEEFFVEIVDINSLISAVADPDTVFFGESTTLSVTELPNADYQWSPSDFVNSPNSSTTVVTPPESMTFTVMVTDENGCSGTASVPVEVIVVVCKRPEIFFPNAFSPNGDGVNDVLRVRGRYIEEIELYIYDRWGEKVFETTDPNQGWDGTFKGNDPAPDVYGYYLRVRCIGGDEFMEQGNITILN